MADLLLLIILLLVPFLWLGLIDKLPKKKLMKILFPKIGNLKTESLGAIKLFILLVAAFFILSTVLSVIGLNDLNNVGTSLKGSIGAGAIIFAITIGITVFAEDFFFRAFMVPKFGIVIPTIIFAALHFSYGSVAEVIGAFALGLILAYWYKKSNSLVQVYIAHILYDIFAVVMYLLL